MPVPLLPVVQPPNSYPVRTIFPRVARVTLTVPVAVTESTFGAPVAPLTSKRIKEFHWANKVIFCVGVNTVPVSYRVPDPFAAVFQPANVYPVFAIVPDANVREEPIARVVAAGTVPDVAVFESKVTLDPHCAKSLMFAVGV